MTKHRALERARGLRERGGGEEGAGVLGGVGERGARQQLQQRGEQRLEERLRELLPATDRRYITMHRYDAGHGSSGELLPEEAGGDAPLQQQHRLPY